MKAAIIEKPRTISVKEVDEPVCGENEIKIKVNRAAICNFSDTEIYTGTTFMLDALGGYPHILGHENSGEVVEIGKNVQGFKKGERIGFYYKGTGAFAEYNVIPSSLAIAKLDDAVSFDEGAILELAGGGAMRNVYGSGLRPADKAVILGAGPAGLFTGMAAKLFGAETWVAIDLIDFRLEKALELGAACAFNLGKLSEEEIAREIQKKVGEIDIVFETMGADHSQGQGGLDLAVKLVKPGGDVRLFSFAPSAHKLSIGKALLKGINFIGRKVSIEKTRDLINLAQRWIAEGRYPVRKVITHHVSLDEVEKGIKLVMEHPEKTLKVIVSIT
ncbi:MAG: zinc-binding dehydrogenase [Spirochaetota bacterium]